MQKTFQEQLRDTILNKCDPKLSKREMLEDIFKTYVAKMMEQNVMANKNRLESKFLVMLKGHLITEFRRAELGEFQISEEMYSNLFDKTVQEIFNDAALANKGVDTAVEGRQVLEINKNAYHREQMRMSKGGIYIPSGVVI